MQDVLLQRHLEVVWRFLAQDVGVNDGNIHKEVEKVHPLSSPLSAAAVEFPLRIRQVNPSCVLIVQLDWLRTGYFRSGTILLLFRGCHRQPLYCFHLDFRCVTLVQYIYIYIYIYVYIYII